VVLVFFPRGRDNNDFTWRSESGSGADTEIEAKVKLASERILR
jgi:hypothetical protein